MQLDNYSIHSSILCKKCPKALKQLAVTVHMGANYPG